VTASVTVRPMPAEDAEYVIDLCALPHARRFVVVPTVEQVLSALDATDATTFVMESDGRRVGLVGLARVGEPVWLVEFRLLVIGEPGKGYGAAATRWAQEHAFVSLGAHRMYLEVTADNARARALYEHAGFAQEGIFRDGFRSFDGTYRDFVAYGMLEDEYRPPRPRS
jgi:RimJ/RimL family protein N-acetyltransferase